MSQTLENFTPSRDWVIIHSLRQEKTDAGIFIPESSQKELHESAIQEVLAAGPESGCKPGDYIYLHPETNWYPIIFEGKEYGLINQYGFFGTFK